MNSKYANAVPLGYAALSIVLWMGMMMYANWYTPEAGMFGGVLAFTLGGLILGIAGIFSYLNGNAVDGILFLVSAAFLWGISMVSHHMPDSSAAMGNMAAAHSYAGWADLGWAIVVFFIWLVSLKSGIFKMLFLLGFWVTLLFFTVAGWSSSEVIRVIGAYVGLVTAILGMLYFVVETMKLGKGAPSA